MSGVRVRVASPAGAGVLAALTLAAGAACVPLAVVARQAPGNDLYYAAVTLLAMVLGGVGLVVAWHQPRNRMGWLLLGSGACFALAADASLYATLAYRLYPGRLPLGWAAVLLQPGWGLAFIFLSLAVLLFPDGRLPSRRWRRPLLVYLAVSALWVGGALVIIIGAIIRHHVQIDSGGSLAVIDHPTGAAVLWGAFEKVYLVVLVACLLVTVVQQALGYRRSSGERRHQLKWLASAGAGTGSHIDIDQPTRLRRATGGQERTNTEYGHLLTAAGLSFAKVQPGAAPCGVIEGTQPERNTGKPARDNAQANQFCAHRSWHGHTALAAPNGGYLESSPSTPRLTRTSAAYTCRCTTFTR